MGLVDGVDRELPDPLALGPGPGNQVDADQLAAGPGDRRGQLAERLLPRIELDPDGDAVLSTDCGHSSNYMRPGMRVPTAAV